MKEGEQQHSEGIQQAEIDKLFSQLTTAEVDEFYQAYRLWHQRQRVIQIQQELQALRQKQAQNTARMQSLEPSVVVLSAIAQLRVHGVDDTELLDRMLDRGEEWLDNTMQLLARCEELNVIQGNYAQWCEHALEGAYEWMWSMDDASLSTFFDVEQPTTAQPQESIPPPANHEEVTEAQLLQKLMSEEDEEKAPARPQARVTQPLPVISPEEVLAQSEAFMPLNFWNTFTEEPQEIAAEATPIDLQYDEKLEDTHKTSAGEVETAAAHDQAMPIEAEAAAIPQPEPVNAEQVSEPSEIGETQAEETSSDSAMVAVEQSEEEANALTDTPPPEQLSDAPSEELLSDAPSEELLLQDEPPEQPAPIKEEEPAPEERWPYVYQQVQDKQVPASSEIQPDHHTEPEEPATATSDDKAKPHAADDDKSRGLLKRSLNRFMRR